MTALHKLHEDSMLLRSLINDLLERSQQEGKVFQKVV